MFTASTMSATSFRPIADVSTPRWKSILLSASVAFLICPGNSASTVLSGSYPRLAIVVHIRLLTVWHIYTCELDVPAATTVVMLFMWRAVKGVTLAGGETSVE